VPPGVAVVFRPDQGGPAAPPAPRTPGSDQFSDSLDRKMPTIYSTPVDDVMTWNRFNGSVPSGLRSSTTDNLVLPDGNTTSLYKRSGYASVGELRGRETYPTEVRFLSFN